MVESDRINYLRTHQTKLRAHMYKSLIKASNQGNNDPSSTGKRIVLPSSFTGGPRYMIQNYQDAMTICSIFGYPHLFITFTCNPKWPEITRFVQQRGLRYEDRPDIVCRVFKIKLDDMVKTLREGKIFGPVKSLLYTIEFQKRGLPHAHILLFLDKKDKCPTPEDIDKIISAEIPDPINDSTLHNIVSDLMIYGPCNNNSSCMNNGKCNKHYPKSFVQHTTVNEDGFPVYKRRRNGRIVLKGTTEMDNRHVVPYNRDLLLRYNAHINVEWCNQSMSIKYLFKYISKGNDRVTMTLSNQQDDCVNEIKEYFNCRYVSPCEAVWRLLCFDIHFRTTPIQRLNFHLEGEQNVVFDDDAPIDDVVSKAGANISMFEAWMKYNENHSEARHLTYSQFPEEYTWSAQKNAWHKRKNKRKSYGRIYNASPGSGERYYLRILLNRILGAKSYADLRTIDGTVHPTFKDACFALGLLDDEKEYIDGIKESSFWASARYLRHLFVMLLLSGSMSRPEYVWANTWKELSDNILTSQRRILRIEDLRLSEEQLQNYALAEIEKMLQKNGATLENYPSMPLPDQSLVSDGMNKMIQDELQYDKNELVVQHEALISRFTHEQKSVYDEIMQAVDGNSGGVFFLYGHGGTGKTFIWRSLSAAIRSRGEIVINVASSGIAALLIPGGRTAHSRFHIPIQVHEESTCHIMPGTDLTGLIAKAKLIIWDEAPMVNKYSFEALDRILRDVMRNSNPNSFQQPFGGKVVVFGGDFRQILPVVPRGSRQDIVYAAINSSYLWKYCKVLRLTRNMRLQNGCTDSEVDEARQFSEWILRVGDGREGSPNDGEATIEIPSDVLITETTNPIATIVETVYPSFIDIPNSAEYFQERAILAPTHDIVQNVNDYMLSLLPGEEKIYLSSDSICKSDDNHTDNGPVYSVEYLNSIQCSGVPNHVLKLKVGVPVMLLRNIDQSSGLCNGTRLLITRLGDHVIEARIISGIKAGDHVLIPRMLLTPSDTRYPFRFQRRQFPLIVCFAMTINKSQGQSRSQVGLYLPRPIFTHGQLYVAVSRVTTKNGLKILICDSTGQPQSTTINVVYKEVFQNLT